MSRFVDISDLEIVYMDTGQPSTIGVEACLGVGEVFGVYCEESGRRAIRFDGTLGLEFDPIEFRDAIDTFVGELVEWETKLRLPGGVWSDESMGKS